MIAAEHPELGARHLSCEGAAALLFTENETNTERLFGAANRTPFVKDGIDRCIVHGQRDAVNPQQQGTKAAAHYPLTIPAGQSRVIRLRLHDAAAAAPFGTAFDAVMEARRREADEFYATVIPKTLDADAANVMRQALAGMLWSKQFYRYDVDRWLEERGAAPFESEATRRPAERALASRGQRRHHLDAGQVGVPLVRGVGPGLPRARPHPGGRGLRQAAARPDAPAAVSPPQRADSRLRVELRGRQPARARLVHHLHLHPGARAARPGGRRLARAGVPQAGR